MKRFLVDINEIVSWENLILSFYKTATGKNRRDYILNYEKDLWHNLKALQEDFLSNRAPYGRFSQFTVFDPKRRIIFAPCFEDRILHHAIINVIGLVFEKSMTVDTFACRKAMGSHSAVLQAQKYSKKYPWFVKTDVRRYFNSIDHEVLLELLFKKFKGPHIGQVFRKILNSYEHTPGKVLPIGALTSQYFANFYLDGADRFIRERLKVPGYVRYMDDMLWFAESKKKAKADLEQLIFYLSKKRGLVLKDNVEINNTKMGLTFCGFRVFPNHIALSRRKKKRYIALRNKWELLFKQGHISSLRLQKGYDAVVGALWPANNYHWRLGNLKRVLAVDA